MMSKAHPPAAPSEGLAGVAIDGSAWTTAQAVVSKVAVLAATWVVALKLLESDVAVAALVMTATKVLCVLPPLNMGDVLVARGAGFRACTAAAARVVLSWSVLIVLGIAALSPVLGSFYSHYPRGLFVALLCIAGLRVLGESLQVIPLVHLRMAFRYRRVALIDGGVQLVASITTIVLAWSGAGAWSLVGPLAAAAFAKALLYRWAIDDSGPVDPADDDARSVSRDFRLAGGAQYVHSLVDTAPLLIIGRCSDDIQTGLFAFAFNLAAQANAIVGGQLSGVLQPVLASLAHAGERQVAGFLRTLRVLSAVIVPVCLTQAVLAEPLFRVVFPERWLPSAPVFAMLCLSEALFFAAAPTMALLRAQGRFSAFLAWQGIHLLVSVVLLPIAAWKAGALGVAMTTTGLWAVSLPLAVMLAVRPGGVGPRTALTVFFTPWITCVPIVAMAWFVVRWLDDQSRLGAWIALVSVGPLAFGAMVVGFRWTQPATYSDLTMIAGRIVGRVLRRRA
jgi:O-antigen/teichoic acid export membrane protein